MSFRGYIAGIARITSLQLSLKLSAVERHMCADITRNVLGLPWAAFEALRLQIIAYISCLNVCFNICCWPTCSHLHIPTYLLYMQMCAPNWCRSSNACLAQNHISSYAYIHICTYVNPVTDVEASKGCATAIGWMQTNLSNAAIVNFCGRINV